MCDCEINNDFNFFLLYCEKKDENKRLNRDILHLQDRLTTISDNNSNLINLIKRMDKKNTDLLNENNFLKSINDNEYNSPILKIEKDGYTFVLENTLLPKVQVKLIKRSYREDFDCPICLETIKSEDLTIPNCECNNFYHKNCFDSFIENKINHLIETDKEGDLDCFEINCPLCRFDFCNNVFVPN